MLELNGRSGPVAGALALGLVVVLVGALVIAPTAGLAQSGGVPAGPTSRRPVDLHAVAGVRLSSGKVVDGTPGTVGYAHWSDFAQVGIALVSAVFLAATNPPRDRDGNTMGGAAATVPSHLEGSVLGHSAAESPAMAAALPSQAAGPSASAILSPYVTHLLDAPPAGDAPIDAHDEALREDNTSERLQLTGDEGKRRGDTLGLTPPRGRDPSEFEQGGRLRTPRESLRAGVRTSRAREGEPVDPSTGEFFVEETDLHVPGVGLDFVVGRFYRSSSRYIGSLGFGWATNYEQYLVRSAEGCALTGGATQDVIDWYTGEGVAVRFKLHAATGRWVPEQGLSHTLTRLASEWRVTDSAGNESVFSALTYPDPTDSSLLVALPRELRDRNGNRVVVHANMRPATRLTSSPIQVSRVEDTMGRQFTFVYDTAGFLKAVSGAGASVTYSVDARLDLVFVRNAEGVAEHYEYDYDASRAAVVSRYPSAFVERQCAAECGDLGYCGACSGVHLTERTACESRCNDTQACIDGDGPPPSCVESCDGPCTVPSALKDSCMDYCVAGTYQVPVSACEALRPYPHGSPEAIARGCRDYSNPNGIRSCGQAVQFDHNTVDPVDVTPRACCAQDLSQYVYYESCLENPPIVENDAIGEAVVAACEAARPAIRAACDAECPSRASCSEACLRDSPCGIYQPLSNSQSFNFPAIETTGGIGFSVYWYTNTWVLDRREYNCIASRVGASAMCADEDHPDWLLNRNRRAVFDPVTLEWCPSPLFSENATAFGYPACVPTCMGCMQSCEGAGMEACRTKVATNRQAGCATACEAYLGASCTAGCESDCAAACADPADCLDACASADFGGTCVDECTTACVDRNTESDGGVPLPRYGNPIDLDHNLLRIRDGDGRVYLVNEYQPDYRQPTFDRVVRQTFGAEQTTFSTYALDPAPQLAPADVGRVDVSPVAVELCASSCSEDLSRLGDGERWVDVGGAMGGDYLVFDDAATASWPVSLAEGADDWGALSAFGWYEIERVSSTTGLLRPTVELPVGGLRIGAPGGTLLVSGGADGQVKLAAEGSGVWGSHWVTLVRSSAGWRAVVGQARAAAQVEPANACSAELAAVPHPSGEVTLVAGQCEGLVQVRELGRRDMSTWRPILSTAYGSKTWSFGSEPGRRYGRMMGWSGADEPWAEGAVACQPAIGLDVPEQPCTEALHAWPDGTPRPDCDAPWPTRGAGGGGLPPLGGPSIDCWPETSPVHVEGALPTSCIGSAEFRPARGSGPGVQPFAFATVVSRADGTSSTYYSAADGNLLRVTDNDHHASVDYNYDARQRLVGTRDVHGARTCIQYDDASNPVRTVDLPSPGVAASQAQLEDWVAYGAYGQPTGIYDAASGELVRSFEYDSRGSLRFDRWHKSGVVIEDEYVVDVRGRATDVYSADGSARHVDYSPATGTPVRIEDYERPGHSVYLPGVAVLSAIDITPDAYGRASRVTSVLGRRASAVFEQDLGPLGRVRETRTWLDPSVHPSPMTTGYGYTGSGLVQTITDARTVATLTWTDQGFLGSASLQAASAATVPRTRVECMQYVAGRVQASVDGDGRVTRRLWSPQNPTREELEKGWGALPGEWAAPCASNRVEAGTDGYELFQRQEVAADGRVLAESEGPQSQSADRASTDSAWSYDGFGRPVRRVWANGVVERWDYDGWDRPVWYAVFGPVAGTTAPSPAALANTPPGIEAGTIDPTLVSYEAYGYDYRSRLTERRARWFSREPAPQLLGADGWVTESWVYSDISRLIGYTGPTGETTWSHYDAIGRVDKVLAVDAKTVLVRYDYSAAGQNLVVTTMDGSAPGGQRVETYRYTPWGALEVVEDSQARQLWRGVYDRFGQLTHEYGPADGRQYQYDDFGRLTAVSRRLWQGAFEPFESFGYSAVGLPTKYLDAAGRSTTWLYDGQGRVRQTLLPMGGSESAAYHAGTGLPRLTTGRDGTTTSLSYDGFGEVARAVSSRAGQSSERVYSRDATGLRSARTWNRAGTGPTTADVETSFDYDSLGWVRRERSSLWTNPVTFARDTAGRWTEANLGAQTLSRTFASWDRLDTVRVGTRTIADFEYPPGVSSPTSVAYGNGLTETRSYDHRGRRVSGDARLGAAARFAQTWTWGEDDGLARWDAVVGATRRALVSKADDRGRLVDVGVHTGLSAPASSRATPADVNSWLSGAAQRETYVYDASDRMTEKRVGGTPKYPQHRDDGALISWDGQTVPVDGAGRPTTIGGSVVEYDGAGRLIASTPPNGARTTYLYDGLDRLVGWDVGGVAHRFHYAEGQIVEDREGGTTRLLVPGEGGAPIATVVGAAEYTNLIGPGDRLVASLDAAGTLVERYESMGHAPPRFMNGAGVAQASSTIGNRMLLSGQPWAPQLGSHRQGFRWYQPTWGRFTSTDPLGYIDGPNTFAYGGMNPWRWTDPMGLRKGEMGGGAELPHDRGGRPRATLCGAPGPRGRRGPPTAALPEPPLERALMSSHIQQLLARLKGLRPVPGRPPVDLNPPMIGQEPLPGMRARARQLEDEVLARELARSFENLTTAEQAALARTLRNSPLVGGRIPDGTGNVVRVPAGGGPPVRAPAPSPAPAPSAAPTTGATHGHHAWPKYLGGPSKQDLATLPKSVHEAYHRGLDALLPRTRGTPHYESLSPAARAQALRDLSAYTRAFDAKNGTTLYQSMLRNGFKEPN